MRGVICFDMDGTIVDLYNVPNWLSYLREENPLPYVVAEPMYEMEELNEVLKKLIAADWEIRVISWNAKDATEEYKDTVRTAKLWWLHKYGFPYQQVHVVEYGFPKEQVLDTRTFPAIPFILIDDNQDVRKGWTIGQTIDPRTQDLVGELTRLLEHS